jgi:hypothetical protein
LKEIIVSFSSKSWTGCPSTGVSTMARRHWKHSPHR